MNSFTIAEMQRYSGIKAHTIRIWEKRYNGLKPSRSDGNTRYYDDIQLRRLLNIVSLIDKGYKVSDLCKMPDSGLFELLDNELEINEINNSSYDYFIAQLIAAGMEFNAPYFEKVFSTCVLRFGLRSTYINIIYPMLVRIGLMWSKDSIPPAQEHFISNLIRQKLFSAIDALPPYLTTGKSWLLFLPENEQHELGLLFSQYLLLSYGIKSVYLGPDVPIHTIEKAVFSIRPDNLLFCLVGNKDQEDLKNYIIQLNKYFNHLKIHIACHSNLPNQLNSIRNLVFVHSVIQLEEAIK